MVLRLLTALFAAAVLAASTLLAWPAGSAAWPPLASAGPFMHGQLENMAHSRYALAWTSLYPPHQRLVPQSEYVACELALPFPAPLRSAQTLRVRRTPVRVPGLPKPVQGVAVTEQIALEWYGRDSISFTHTFHLVPVDGRWRWFLSQQRYRLYRRAGCAIGPPL